MNRLNFLKFLLVVCFVYANNLTAQTPNWAWVTTGGNHTLGATNYGAACASQNNGTTYVAGFQGDTMAVQKFDPSGNLIWTTKFRHKSTLNKMNDIALDGDGNCYLVGAFNDTCYFGTTMLVAVPGYNWINAGFLAKLDANGAVLWAIKGNESSRFESVYINNTNQVFVGGYVGNNLDLEIGGLIVPKTSAKKHLFVAEINTSGVAIWGKVFEASNSSAPAGSDCSVNDIITDNAGNIYITGTFSGGTGVTFGTVTLSSQGSEIFIAKTDNAGNLAWVKQSSSSLSYKEASGQGVGVDSNGNVYMLGWIEENTSFGNLSATFEGTTGINTLALVKYDSNGEEQFVKSFAKVKDGYATSKSLGMHTTANGTTYLSSTFSNPFGGTLDFGDGVTETLPLNSWPINFVVKINENGATQWAKVNKNSVSDVFYDLSVDNAENVYVCGSWVDGVGYDSLNPPAGNYGILLAKLGESSNETTVNEASIALEFVHVFPNPTNGIINIETKGDRTFELLDLTGRVIRVFNVFNKRSVDLGSIPSGIYLLKATDTPVCIQIIIE